MPKKRRSDSLGSPFLERKIKLEKEGDVTVARHRLTGVLQDLLNSDEESSSSQEEVLAVTKTTPSKKEGKPMVMRRRKRKAAVDMELKFQHTFVMKMYDRSVDLAQFRDDTPLYPICRAWIANQPRPMPEPLPGREDVEVKSEAANSFDFDSDIIRNVYKLPLSSAPPLESRIPFITQPPLQGVSLDYNGENLPSAKELLQGHLKRWGDVKKQWTEASQRNEARFADSGKILSHIYKNNQLNLACVQ